MGGTVSATATTRWWSPARICQLVAVALALGTGLFAGFAPLGQESTTTVTSDGTVTSDEHGTTLADQLGRGVGLLIAVPVIVALLPLAFRGRAHAIVSWAAAGLMGLGMLAAVLSVGVFYTPTVILLGVAAILTTSRRVDTGRGTTG